MTHRPHPPRHRLFSAAQAPPPGSAWAEVWNHRAILWMLTRRDLRARYAGSMLGVLWNVIHPVCMIVIYILILGTILGQKLGAGFDRGAYTVHMCAGMIPWLVFQEVVLRCGSTLLENANLIKKVVFPEIVLHLTVLFNAVFIHTISYAVFILILLGLGFWPGPAVFACFPLLLAVALLGLGAGLIVSVLNIYFRDVGQVVSLLFQFLFWFTPIVYFPSQVRPENAGVLVRFLGSLIEWNPLVHFTRTSQHLFGDPVSESPFTAVSLAVILLAPLLALLVGLRVFNRFKRDILDNL